MALAKLKTKTSEAHLEWLREATVHESLTEIANVSTVELKGAARSCAIVDDYGDIGRRLLMLEERRRLEMENW